jgi:hypothetical protein
MSARPRDRSADNILLAANTNMTTETSSFRPTLTPVHSSPIHRSVSFKRPQEMNGTALQIRSILKPKKEENSENDVAITKPNENDATSVGRMPQQRDHEEDTANLTRSRSSSQEHIYDNLDVFKRPKPTSHLPSKEDGPSLTGGVQARENPVPPTRPRPLTMLVTASNDKQPANEFQNVYNQFKKRGSIRRVQPVEERAPIPTPIAEPPSLQPPPVPELPKNEPVISAHKIPDSAPVQSVPNRRKTVGGVYIPASNKTATNDNTSAPSGTDIAKQKRSKL